MKQEIYKWIRIGGLLSFIPFILAAGPIAGYIAGDYLAKRFSLPVITPAAMSAIGFLASMQETIRVIKIALKTEKES